MQSVCVAFHRKEYFFRS